MRGEKYLGNRINQVESRPNPALTSKVMLRVVLITGLVLGIVFIGSIVSGYIIDHPGGYYEDKYKEAQIDMIKITYDNGHCTKEHYDWVQANREHLTWRQLRHIADSLWYPTEPGRWR